MHEAIGAILAWIEQWGAWGILIGLIIEVIPSEIVLAYGGYLAAKGEISFWSAVGFGTIGGTLAQLIVYAVGKYGGRPFLERYGKYVLIQKKHLDMAEQWFERYGTGVVFSARFIPVVRHAISVPAGIAGMPLLRFTVLTALAVLPWSIGFVWLGMALGEEWSTIEETAGPYTVPVMAIAAAVTAVYVAFIRRKSKKQEKAAEHKGLPHDIEVKNLYGEAYIVFRNIDLLWEERILSFECVAIGPNGVFVVSSDPMEVYRQARVLRELFRSAHASAEVNSIMAEEEEEAARNIRRRTAKQPLNAETVQMLADLLEERVAS